MPAYRFEALDASGKTQSGLLEGDSARAVRAQLRARSLVPLEVSPVTSESEASGNGAGASLLRRRVFTATTLAVWTRQLAGLVAAGLPLERALTALADEAEEPRQRELLAHLRAEVNAGSPFARALSGAPREFDEVYRAVVAAGEQSGQLGRVLERLADDLEERQALKAKLIGATLYPAIVSVVAVVIVIFLVTYVVPQVAQVFAGSKKALPLLTSAMLAISAFLRQWGWALLLALIGAGTALVLMRRNEATRERLDAAVLRLPLFGRLARGYNAARFAGTLAMLAGSGVPILKALQAAAETLSNRAMRADAMEALVQVREGAPLASALAAKKRFPGLLAMFARLGEQTGELPLMLQRAATQLGAEVQRRAMQTATILEPLLIVGMGGIVMVIVLAVLLPIIQLNTFVK
ncbi:general secretion pathway protein F [Sphaerotilus natans subsp. natans DSM 6575]|uniref:General secretion pathway protein F n=1 Tax=Sphaerotilus natans subsp. natans DSM 6575 TaxID=1286631 RepID=A0A059KI91_9BURK|nr:type II secretion system inner membrane protein GspF [Sphaerotilus natans]KDB51065.1 general secretion pathway protein F [Sphaerotilus natans subsp. natans DSM 6575]SIR84952.1 general secretion pathway protein F [Sphaerotilus natans]